MNWISKTLVGGSSVIAILLVAQVCVPDDRSRATLMHIQYAIFLSGHSPATGRASCIPARDCILFEAGAFSATLRVVSASTQSSGEFVVRCEDGCVLANGTGQAQFRNIDEFFFSGVDIFSAESAGESKRQVGRIFLNFESPIN